MTKTEKTLLDRVREENDKGHAPYNPVKDKKGAKRSWRRGGGREYAGRNKLEEAAWERLKARGDVVKVPLHGGYVIPDHPCLVEFAAQVCLPGLARHVEEKRQALEEQESRYADALAFVRKYGNS